MSVTREQVMVVGGAGFIGSHFIDALMADDRTVRVTVYDNFSSGREWHYAAHEDDERLRVVRADANDLPRLCEEMTGHDLVIHLASNPDVASAMTTPAIDFDQGTMITHHVLEAMHATGVPRIAYASGSGVYGDRGELEAVEDQVGLEPVSTYGASKLAGEALISAYAHMFDIQGVAFRFGNVVGRRQTHGVGFDFVRRLRDDPTHLTVLGDGTQSKSYILASDVVAAVLRALDAQLETPFISFNVATRDYLTVREIVQIALDVLRLDPAETRVEYGTEARGWKGDVPVVRLNTERIRALGWQPTAGSAGALRASIESMLDDLAVGRG